jgi:hypothetical protein
MIYKSLSPRSFGETGLRARQVCTQCVRLPSLLELAAQPPTLSLPLHPCLQRTSPNDPNYNGEANTGMCFQFRDNILKYATIHPPGWALSSQFRDEEK